MVSRTCQGKVHWKNLLEQLKIVGPKSIGVAMLTAGFVGMVFTIQVRDSIIHTVLFMIYILCSFLMRILKRHATRSKSHTHSFSKFSLQFVREFAKLGLTRSVGGVLALALARELTPVVTSIILAGRVGSAFAAELGTMQVSEQTDTLRVLRTDPVDYLITPRVLACMIALPVLNILCLTIGLGAGASKKRGCSSYLVFVHGLFVVDIFSSLAPPPFARLIVVLRRRFYSDARR